MCFSLLPVTPTFGPGLDFGMSVSMRSSTAADKLSNSALEIGSGGVDGIFSVLYTLLPSRNHFAAAANTSRRMGC